MCSTCGCGQPDVNQPTNQTPVQPTQPPVPPAAEPVVPPTAPSTPPVEQPSSEGTGTPPTNTPPVA